MPAPKINLLQESVISQIAAGEVIQRPASALKELLENALDAHATEIKVFTQEGGKKLLQVMDNGQGMSPEDARLCFTQHATSKLHTIDELATLHTYGFRGEAMSALRAAAARVVLKTKTNTAELGTEIMIENGKIIRQEPTPMESGTQVCVYHLFGNIPARLHFLKSNSIENSHIIDVFQQMAIARPEVAFSLHQNKKDLYHLPIVKKVSQRLIHTLGKSYQAQMIPCAEKTEDISIKGYVGKPEFARKVGKKHFFYVNARYIKSRYLHHAVKKAFENLIPPESAPFYALFITIDPKKVDVNVHPTKAEVKFDNEKILHALVTSCIRKALSDHQIMPSIDFEKNNYTHFPFLAYEDTELAPASPEKEEVIQNEEPQKLWVESVETRGEELPRDKAKAASSYSHVQETTPHQKLQVHRKYIITPVKSGILFIDQQKAYERILYDQKKRARTEQMNHIQRLLFPIKVKLDPVDFTLVQSCQETIHELGFEFQVKEENDILITGQPTGLKTEQLGSLFGSILEEYKTNLQEHTDRRESWLRALSKRACAEYTVDLSSEETEALLNQLFRCENPNYTPTGSRIWRIAPLKTIEYIIAQEDGVPLRAL